MALVLVSRVRCLWLVVSMAVSMSVLDVVDLRVMLLTCVCVGRWTLLLLSVSLFWTR